MQCFLFIFFLFLFTKIINKDILALQANELGTILTAHVWWSVENGAFKIKFNKSGISFYKQTTYPLPDYID